MATQRQQRRQKGGGKERVKDGIETQSKKEKEKQKVGVRGREGEGERLIDFAWEKI